MVILVTKRQTDITKFVTELKQNVILRVISYYALNDRTRNIFGIRRHAPECRVSDHSTPGNFPR
jgi:hypothetical protein